jgi:hypothetical protein
MLQPLLAESRDGDGLETESSRGADFKLSVHLV